MTSPDDRSSTISNSAATPRREFFGQFAASAIVLAGAACSTVAATPVVSGPQPTAAPAQSPPPAPASSAPAHWDDSWFARLTAKHKAVFDAPQIEDGLVLANASGYIRGMRDAVGAGPNDVQAVIVIRHAAIAMAFNDAMWAKYEIGKDKQIKAPRSEQWATRNPYMGGSSGASGSGRGGDTSQTDRPQGNLSWLASRGHVLLGCDLATRNYAGQRARALKLDQAAVYEDFKANLVPGLILQPTGVYAALRAQEAGCGYLRST